MKHYAGNCELSCKPKRTQKPMGSAPAPGTGYRANNATALSQCGNLNAAVFKPRKAGSFRFDAATRPTAPEAGALPVF
ncbi:MAG TPA: hypothetical protein VFB72_04095 [Verrucomicrobiae bacterium]|nr:hypothetical protein [Verrucomicrobiae bacterium]